jgi:tetratricopeptide (TPR) repeat protein
MEQILKINPDHALALNYVGYTYADKGIRLQEALDLLTKANQIKPEDGYIIDSLAWAYFKSGNKTKALELLQKANQLSPNEPTILEHLGDVYLDMREKDKARGYFQEAVAAAAKEVNPEARDLEDLKRIQSKLGALNP